MPVTIDPLIILKENIANKKPIEKQGNYLVFSDSTKLKLDTPTACMKAGTKKQYNLGSLWLFLQHLNDPRPEYVRECGKDPIFDIVSKMDTGIITIINNNRCIGRLFYQQY
jgi:hypothetical protein